MKRIHALLIATAVAVAAVLGLLAATRTLQLGTASSQPKVTPAQIAGRSRALDRIEATLAAQARRKPPALPALPTTPASAAPAPRVTYVRPKPIVRVVHRHGEHDHESSDDGGGLDD